jgi:hypothetical protein
VRLVTAEIMGFLGVAGRPEAVPEPLLSGHTT